MLKRLEPNEIILIVCNDARTQEMKRKKIHKLSHKL